MCGVQAAGATERYERELRRIVSPLYRYDP